MSKDISFEKLSEIIVSAIREEQYFSKEVLIPKVQTLIKAFRINLSTAKYEAIEKPKESAIRLREIEKMTLERDFWKSKVRNLVGEKIDGYFHELDTLRKGRGF